MDVSTTSVKSMSKASREYGTSHEKLFKGHIPRTYLGYFPTSMNEPFCKYNQLLKVDHCMHLYPYTSL